jgi:nitrite reductase/ring-hydroxylating ferredoxin subunit
MLTHKDLSISVQMILSIEESTNDPAMTFVVEVEGQKLRVPIECPHRKGRLNHGYFRGHCIVCPLHYSVFDLRTGKCLKGPADDDLVITSVNN